MSYSLPRRSRQRRQPSWLKLLNSVWSKTRTQQRQGGFSPHGSMRTGGGRKCLPRLFQSSSRRNMMSIKGDKNFNTSICGGSASKPQNLTFGVELLSACQKNVPSVHMFHKVHFFSSLFLVRFVLNNPQTFFIS